MVGISIANSMGEGKRLTRLELVSVLTWKLRITVLWIIYAVCYPLAMILLMFEPGVIRHLMAGVWFGRDAHSAGLQIKMAAIWLIPPGMACLTLFLKDAVSRWTNRVVGTLFAVQGILHLFGLMADGTLGGVYFIDLVMSLVALLLAWRAATRVGWVAAIARA